MARPAKYNCDFAYIDTFDRHEVINIETTFLADALQFKQRGPKFENVLLDAIQAAIRTEVEGDDLCFALRNITYRSTREVAGEYLEGSMTLMELDGSLLTGIFTCTKV